MKLLSKELMPVQSGKHAHASSICIKDGKPLIAWFEGSREGAPDVTIKLKYEDRIINFNHNITTSNGVNAHWNPVLFSFKEKTFMFFKLGSFCNRWQTFLSDITDLDNIRTEILPAGLNGCVKTKPIVIDNRIYCGSSVETEYNWTSYIEMYTWNDEDNFFRFSERSAPIFKKPEIKSQNSVKFYPQVGFIQPSLWHDGKQFNCFMRSYSLLRENQLINYSCSINGLNWTDPLPTDLPNPNSSVDTVFYKNHLYLIFNPSASERLPLITIKLDQNLMYIEKLEIEKEAHSGCVSPQLSYPSVIIHEGFLHVTFTNGRNAIQYNIIQLD